MSRLTRNRNSASLSRKFICQVLLSSLGCRIATGSLILERRQQINLAKLEKFLTVSANRFFHFSGSICRSLLLRWFIARSLRGVHLEKWTSQSMIGQTWNTFVIERALKVIRQRTRPRDSISWYISTVSRYKISRDDAIEQTGRLRIIIGRWKYKCRGEQRKSFAQKGATGSARRHVRTSSRLISMH
jgi:hypothetical protein